MCGETNMELHVNADFWSNNDTGQIFFGNNHSLQITLMVYTLWEKTFENMKSLWNLICKSDMYCKYCLILFWLY